MANWLVALLISLAAGTWLYEMLIKKTGNNHLSSIIAAVISGILLFIVLYFVLGIIFD